MESQFFPVNKKKKNAESSENGDSIFFFSFF